ncbi:MAG: GAF domain-containing protein [Acidobacteria bacterium]|nr:GAF domain-containing protein [Acidobacteriota bacterium]
MKLRAKQDRYHRIYKQLQELLTRTADPVARMATIVALLHHKMEHFFWTGFYRLVNGELTVGPYQGPLACQVLARDQGVCWAGINREESLIVDDVEQFPGHIPCDARSRSEVVIPLRTADGTVVGVLDVDSDGLAAFDEVDRVGLERIVTLVFPSATLGEAAALFREKT